MVIKDKKSSRMDGKTDKRVMDEICYSLQNIDAIRLLEMNDISIDVDNGEVLLTGHLENDGYKQSIESIVENISDVTVVTNELIGDRKLESKVAQALAKDARTCQFFIYVGVFHGWVHINGHVPTTNDQVIVEQVAASLPEVRGVATLPQIITGQKLEKNHIVQPLIGAKVYDQIYSPGVVCQVVINPHNRLVISAIVEVPLRVGRKTEESYYVVTSNFMRVVYEEGIILEDSLPDMTSSPLFNQVEFKEPPEDWRPPFPYKPGEVLWPKGESNV